MHNTEKKTILLVEDEAVIAMMEKMNLESYGYDVVIAESGKRAVEIVSEQTAVNLILMDINLGDGIDGTEAAEIILRNHDIPIVFLSSHSTPEVVEKTEMITSYGYVVKNTGITVLDASIKMAFKLFEANKTISEKEAAQDAMIANISDIIEIVDEDLKIVYLSPNVSKWFGWQAQDLIQTDCLLIIHPDDVERINRDLKNLLKEEKGSKKVEYRHKCRDGTYKPIEMTAINLINDEKIKGLLINFHDISERKKSEEIIRQSEEKYALINDSSNDSIYSYNKDGRFTSANRNLCKILNLVPEQILGKTHTELGFPENLSKEWDNLHQQVYETDKTVTAETKATVADGQVHDYEVILNPLHDNNGRIIGIGGTTRDITERKRIENALHRNKDMLRYILDAIPQSIFWKDLNSKYMGCNQVFAESAGVKVPEEIIGKTDYEMPWADIAADAYREDDKWVMANNQAKRHIIEQIQYDDGRLLWVDTTKIPLLDEQGRVYGILGAFDDITARKEEQEKINHLLEINELALKQVHHHLKNNMSTIAGLLSLQAENVKEETAASALKEAGSRIRSMMLLYKKLYQSDIKTHVSAKSYLSTLVEDIVSNFPNNSSIAVDVDISDFSLTAAIVQPIGIIVNELLTNIMKYAFTGRAEGIIRVTAAQKGNKVSLSISDNGNGIPESINFKNSAGFGLQLVEILTAQLKGNLQIERENGTKITLEFTYE